MIEQAVVRPEGIIGATCDWLLLFHRGGTAP
jgi:hypothetical protein